MGRTVQLGRVIRCATLYRHARETAGHLKGRDDAPSINPGAAAWVWSVTQRHRSATVDCDCQQLLTSKESDYRPIRREKGSIALLGSSQRFGFVLVEFALI